MFGVIGQNLLNMLKPDKRQKSCMMGVKVKYAQGEEEKKKKGARFGGNLSWHLYLMDLIKKEKKRKSIGRKCRKTFTSIRNE